MGVMAISVFNSRALQDEAAAYRWVEAQIWPDPGLPALRRRGSHLTHEGQEHPNRHLQVLKPTLVAAGVVNKHGHAKYAGLHALRHFYASWCINRKIDGGLELPLKVVQARLGHASIQMTADTYGHLFPRGDDGAELAAAEQAFLGG
jgi:integrase